MRVLDANKFISPGESNRFVLFGETNDASLSETRFVRRFTFFNFDLVLLIYSFLLVRTSMKRVFTLKETAGSRSKEKEEKKKIINLKKETR